jgi:hypothetical protein
MLSDGTRDVGEPFWADKATHPLSPLLFIDKRGIGPSGEERTENIASLIGFLNNQIKMSR